MSVTLDALHGQGRAALLQGAEVRDVPPTAGSRRWGVSVLVRPQPGLAARLDEVTAELLVLAGPDQWATGFAATSHLTLFSLEAHRPDVSLADPACGHYADAMHRAADTAGPATFGVTGLALTPGGVVAACETLDDGARALRPALTAALGGDVFEAGYRGDQWWLSLLHLAAPVRAPAELVDHVEDRRDHALGQLTARALELVRYEYCADQDGARMVPVTLSSAPLTGVPEGASGGAHA